MSRHVDSLLSTDGDILQHPQPTARREWLKQAALAACAPWLLSQGQAAPAAKPVQPTTGLILSYSRFATKSENGAVSRAMLAAHFKAIKEAKANVISMVDLVAHHAGRLSSLPPRPIVLSVDDCHRSVVDVLMPMIHGNDWLISLYVSGEKVGEGKQVLSWDEVSRLHHSGRFSVQSRTLNGLNLVKERRNRSPEDYAKFALGEIQRGKEMVEERLVKPVSFQAWPEGAFNKDLIDLADDLGLQASVGLGNRPATLADSMQALPRMAMHEGIDGNALKKIIHSAFPG